jgi:GLPGLI family protein
MKYLLSLLILPVSFSFVFAQVEGRIVYNETVKIEIEGLTSEMADMIPTTQSVKKDLLFKGHETVYQNVKGEELEDLEMESEDGSFKIKMMRDDVEDILYKNLKEKKTIHQKGLMGKTFVVSDDLNKNKWKITNEKIKYLDYECQKAVIEEDDKFVVAWFTSQIPAQIGPGKYHGLPGAILMISVDDGKREIKALSIDMNEVDPNLLKAPNDGKKVTEAEYQRIQDEKMKEMEERYGSRTVKIRH